MESDAEPRSGATRLGQRIRSGRPVHAGAGPSRVFAGSGLILEPRGVRFGCGHPGHFGFREPDGQEQPYHVPTRDRLDDGTCGVGLASGPSTDDRPEALFGDSELIPEDPLEQILADLGAFVVRDLGPQARAVRQVSEVAPMITGPSAAPSEAGLLGPSVVGDVLTQVPERRQGSAAGDGRLRRLGHGFGEQDRLELLVRSGIHEPINPRESLDHVGRESRALVVLEDAEELIDLVE